MGKLVLAASLLAGGNTGADMLMRQREGDQQQEFHAYQAEGIEAEGTYNAMLREREGKALAGSQLANAGASGISFESGSMMDILSKTDTDTWLDSKAIRTNARQRAGTERYQGRLAKSRSRAMMPSLVKGAQTFGNAMAAGG